MSEYLVLDADLFIPTGTPASAEQVHAWLADGTITQEVFDALGPKQTVLPEVVEEAEAEYAVEDEEVSE